MQNLKIALTTFKDVALLEERVQEFLIFHSFVDVLWSERSEDGAMEPEGLKVRIISAQYGGIASCIHPIKESRGQLSYCKIQGR